MHLKEQTSDSEIWDSLKYENHISKQDQMARLVWNIVWRLIFYPTPRWTLHNWRRTVLSAFGAKLDKGSVVRPTSRIWAPWNLKMGPYSCLGDRVDCYCVAPIVIGGKVTVSQDAFLCSASHSTRTLTRELIAAPITIENHVWIAARAFIGPGVTIGEGAVVAACAVVVKDVEPWVIVAGNPAEVVKERELLED